MPAPPVLLHVAVPVPVPRLFDYLPADPSAPPPVGARVRVAFGAQARIGVVVGHGVLGADTDPDALKTADAIDAAPLLGGELLESLRWLARYTHAPLGEVIATALPGPLRHGEALPDIRRHAWRLTEAGATARPTLRPGRPRALADLLADAGAAGVDEDALFDGLSQPRAAARALQSRGLAERVQSDAPVASRPTPGPVPNGDQRLAIDAIESARAGFAAFLLDGVTGSGKTEVYLHAIISCLARGRQALVLVPEIGLTPQLLTRFRARLGIAVHVLHSRLSDGERVRTWAACRSGDARVVVGTRSAVFLPMPQAGLIVVDEEHDSSFKQLDGIRYHARDFALVRAKALGVPIVLGSATPSLESLHNVQRGRSTHLHLRARAGDARPPQVRVVDVRKRPLESGLSPDAFEAIAATLRAGGQALVFKNRRGYAPVLQCHDCGWSAHCPRCSAPDRNVPMTVHAAGRRLQCHHCGTRRPAPDACPDCGGLALQPQGAGTERIEDALLARFADVPVLRIDRGTTTRRDALETQLAGFGDAPGILVGTQMLAKGHDLPNLRLVVVVGIDEGLFSADFRAPEKLAQLLIQVAGRAGRAAHAGTVLLQTHHPDHPLLATLLSGGYAAFAGLELDQRAQACFPPFAHMALVRAEAQQADAARGFLEEVRALVEPHPLELHGPLPAPMPRRAGYLRMQLIVSSTDRRALHAGLDAMVPAIHAMPAARRVRWSLDVDPVDLY